ncbi:MAG: hypothetical protein AB7F82_00685 [Alphaproteobacteria bacterium]
MTDPINDILSSYFARELSHLSDPEVVTQLFFETRFTHGNLEPVCRIVCESSADIGGRKIPGSLLIKGKTSAAPLIIQTQLHGNEPAGLAGILLSMLLSKTGLLEKDVLAVVGNPLAARQYYAALEENPKARQQTRDAYRCGLDKNGSLLPDMNRIPVDFATRDPSDPHTKRAQELYHLCQHACGILDLHTARGNMVCITDHKHDADLKHTPIRAILLELADAISANVSNSSEKKVTLKTLVSPLENIRHQIGIEAGTHESPDAPYIAASFVLASLYRMGFTAAEPVNGTDDDGEFEGYHVKPRITYADLEIDGTLDANDKVYMVEPCTEPEELPSDATSVVIRKDDGAFGLQTFMQFMVQPKGELYYALRQYDEMEPVQAGQVIAVAVPSGIELKTKEAFSGIFWSKYGVLYDKDPAVGPWPVKASELDKVKLCYPCEVKATRIKF